MTTVTQTICDRCGQRSLGDASLEATPWTRFQMMTNGYRASERTGDLCPTCAEAVAQFLKPNVNKS